MDNLNSFTGDELKDTKIFSFSEMNFGSSGLTSFEISGKVFLLFDYHLYFDQII